MKPDLPAKDIDHIRLKNLTDVRRYCTNTCVEESVRLIPMTTNNARLQRTLMKLCHATAFQ